MKINKFSDFDIMLKDNELRGGVHSLIKSDFRRFTSSAEALMSASFAVTFWFRVCSWMMRKNKLVKIAGIPFYLWYKLHKVATGIQLPLCTDIGAGLRFFHYNCIIIAQEVVIGSNVSIHQGVTIGRVFNGKKAGVPTIGNNVVVFAGAKILGNVTVGDFAVIGANAVVTSDVPPHTVVAGVPAKVISGDSSACFSERWAREFRFNE